MGGLFSSLFETCGFSSSSSDSDRLTNKNGGGFGSTSSSSVLQRKVTPHDQAVLDMKIARDKLKMYQRNLEIVMAKEKEMAKQLLRDGKRKRAVLALKKKRYQETLLDNSNVQLNNIQQMIDTIEFTQIEVTVFQEMRKGTATLKQLHEEMSLEAVEQLMSDTQDALEYQNQIDEALSSQLTDVDNAAIEEELEQLEKDTLLIRLPDIPSSTLISSVASIVPAVARKERVKEAEAEEAEEAEEAKEVEVAELGVVEVEEEEEIGEEEPLIDVPKPAKTSRTRTKVLA